MALRLAIVTGATAKRALLVVDMQECFSEGGSLPVEGANSTFHATAANYILENQDLYDKVFFSRDSHKEGHISFAKTHFPDVFQTGDIVNLKCAKTERDGRDVAFCAPHMKSYDGPDNYELADCTAQNPRDAGATLCWDPAHPPAQVLVEDNFAAKACVSEDCKDLVQTLWPDHCVTDSGLSEEIEDVSKKLGDKAKIIIKGEDLFVDSYSALNDNANLTESPLTKEVKEYDEIHVIGLAFDFCVMNSAVSAKALDVKTQILAPLTKAVVPAMVPGLTKTLEEQGITVVADDCQLEKLVEDMKNSNAARIG